MKVKGYGTVLDIHEIMQGLAKRRPVFHSEADFQFALAWQIKETLPDCEVRLEWKPFPEEERRRYLDIFIKSESTVIELKYPTKRIKIKREGEMFAPGLKGGSKTGRYECVEDIARIEETIAKHPDVLSGVFVLLTNRDDFWKPSSLFTKDEAFRLHEGRELVGELLYRDDELPSVNLRGAYVLRWLSYFDFDSGKNSQFRYLAVEVGK